MAGRNQVAEKQKNGAISAFFLALGLAAAIFVPLMIYNKGYFLYLGDFNVQQIPFYKLAHEAVRNGELFWNWKTDLGVNFIGSYSFYLLFSPFFWLTLPFSTEFVPHLMGPLLILKTACAALTAYLYIKRFIRDQGWAVIGSLLYAFSGFMTFNIFFNHFHEAAIFFPLLLVALEELVTNNRRGFFALMVAVNCLVNYWFFLGEVVFVVLYVLLRMITGGWGCTFGKFCAIALESVLGVAVAMVGLLPSVLALVGNPRTGGENLLTGWLMWIYGFNQRLPAIIQSFFFPPEMPSRPNFFPDMGAKWSSLSAWLPLFSATGVIAYCKSRRGDFHKRMIVLSMIMALVPVFNAAFVMFNNSYYARWFYMPILMMCVATASALENRPTMAEGWRSGWNWTFGFVAVISLAVGFSPVKGGDGALTFGLYDHPAGFWMLVAAALLCLLLSRILIFILHETRAFQKITCGMLSALIMVFTLGYLCAGKNTKSYDDWFIQTAIGGREQLRLPPEMETSNRNFVRSDLYDCMDNLGMFWGLPNIQAFHSIVPASLMEFYPSIGIKRDVSSKPPVSYVALRPLLSVRWLWISATAEEQHPMEGYSLVDTQMG
ncbi:MAG: YfhO family protein, partial [Oscillospiraceae bacterium]